MVALTVSEIFDNTLTNEGALRIAYLQGENEGTYTPTNTSGKTIKVLSAYSESGTALGVSVSAGVITVNSGLDSGGEYFTILYTLI